MGTCALGLRECEARYNVHRLQFLEQELACIGQFHGLHLRAHLGRGAAGGPRVGVVVTQKPAVGAYMHLRGGELNSQRSVAGMHLCLGPAHDLGLIASQSRFGCQASVLSGDLQWVAPRKDSYK